MPRATIVLLSLLLHAYVGWRLLPAWFDGLPMGPFASLFAPVFAPLLAAWIAASALLIPLGLGARAERSNRARAAVGWLSLGSMGLFSSLFVLTVLRDAGLLLAWLPAQVWPLALPWSDAARGSAIAVPLLALAVTALGFFNARRTAAVVAVDVPIAGLPAALHGFVIAQISDVHVGPTIGRPYVQAIVDAVNRLDADMVAITGDLVDGSVRDLAADVAPLAGLRSRHGSFFVTGNHDYYSGAAGWIAELRRLGMKVLLNEHVVLRHGEAALLVAGVTDSSAHHFDPAQRSDPQRAMHGAPLGLGAKLLLAHQPRSAPAAADAGFDLQLSGHTHGGQFLPWNWFVPLQQPFTAGLHRLRQLRVYVSRGTGYWGPPKRFGAPSEITRLRLVPGG